MLNVLKGYCKFVNDNKYMNILSSEAFGGYNNNDNNNKIENKL